MAISEAQLRVIMTEYVKTDVLAQQLKDYVPLEEVATSMTPVANAKVDAAIATDEIQNKVAQIAESAVTRLMQQEVQSFDEKLTQLINEVEGLKDSRKPTQDDTKEKDDKSDDAKKKMIKVMMRKARIQKIKK